MAVAVILAWIGSATVVNCHRLSSDQVDCRSITSVAWIPIDTRDFSQVVEVSTRVYGSDTSTNYYFLELMTSGSYQPIAPYDSMLGLSLGTVKTYTSLEQFFLREPNQTEITTRVGYGEFPWLILTIVIAARIWHFIKRYSAFARDT